MEKVNSHPAQTHGQIAKFGPAGKRIGSRSVDVELSIERAMRVMERDIEVNDGVYPYSGGRLTSAEVLRRAGLDRAILQKPRHHELRATVNNWVARSQKRIVQGSKSIRKTVSGRLDETKTEIARIRQSWAEAELFYIDQHRQIDELQRRCRQLEQELHELRSQPHQTKAGIG